LQDIQLFNAVIEALEEKLKGLQIDKIVAIESRGFIFGMPLAVKMGLPLVPIRKKGKLPAEKIEVSYQLEYGEAVIEMHRDAITAGERVVIIDDLLATGGTLQAAVALVEKLQGVVAATAFVVELEALGGRTMIENKRIEVMSVVSL